MVDKKLRIKKKLVTQKQRQKQSVVVNINTHQQKKRRATTKPRKPSGSSESKNDQKQLYYPSIINSTQYIPSPFDNVASVHRLAQIDQALEQKNELERQREIEKAKPVQTTEQQPTQPQITPISTKKKSFVSLISEVFSPPPKPTPTPITTQPIPPPITTTAPRENTVLEPTVPSASEGSIVQYVSNAPTRQYAQSAGHNPTQPYLRPINLPKPSIVKPFSGSGSVLSQTPHLKMESDALRNIMLKSAEARIAQQNQQLAVAPQTPQIKTAQAQSQDMAQTLKLYGQVELLNIARDQGVVIPKVNRTNTQSILYYLVPNLNYDKIK